MSEKPGSFPFRFECHRCGNCCARPEGVVLISAEELARIAEHLDMSEAAVRSRYLAASGDRLANGPDSRCVFLSDGRVTACRIYPVRPERCRTWPYWDQLRDSASALTEAARLCAGIDLSAHDDR